MVTVDLASNHCSWSAQDHPTLPLFHAYQSALILFPETHALIDSQSKGPGIRKLEAGTFVLLRLGFSSLEKAETLGHWNLGSRSSAVCLFGSPDGDRDEQSWQWLAWLELEALVF